MLLIVVSRQPVLKMGSGRLQLSARHGHKPEGLVGTQEAERLTQALGHIETLLRKGLCRLIVGACPRQDIETAQRQVELGSRCHALTERQGAVTDLGELRRSPPFQGPPTGRRLVSTSNSCCRRSGVSGNCCNKAIACENCPRASRCAERAIARSPARRQNGIACSASPASV